MKLESIKLGLVVAAGLGLSACGYNINPYGASANNVDTIKGHRLPPISVAKFESYKPGLNTIGCRAAGPVSTPNETPFEAYIEKALVDELRLAGVYDPKASLAIQGRLEEIDFNSNVGAGKWMMKLSVSSKTKPGYTVESSHEFSTNWVADKACQQVAQAFVPAVQQLISQVVSNPNFKALAQ